MNLAFETHSLPHCPRACIYDCSQAGVEISSRPDQAPEDSEEMPLVEEWQKEGLRDGEG